MGKKIVIGFFAVMVFLALIVLWQFGIFDGKSGVCDPPPGGLGGLRWNEMLVSTDGNFYVNVVNPHNFPITITNISIESRRPSDVTYTIETLLPLQVSGKKDFLIAGRYEPIENIKEGDEYWFYVDITFTNIVAGTVVEHDESDSLGGRYGIKEVPEPC